jgi:hypothetical protein
MLKKFIQGLFGKRVKIISDQKPIKMHLELGELLGSEQDGCIIKITKAATPNSKWLEAEVISVSERWCRENERVGDIVNNGYFVVGETIYLLPRCSGQYIFYFASSGWKEHAPWFILAQSKYGQKYFAHYPGIIGMTDTRTY